ncbi:MAG TPA: NADH-quinone oxidoreductase subunit D [bacterium]|nr:NADH-quinone oxidoreductase subunit D [bacterium]
MTTTALKTEEITLNMGPQHPSTHGVIRFILKTDGEIVHECIPDVGYLHRAIEKISEKMEWQGFIPYTDRVDYLAAMNCNWAYSLAVERLAGIEVPRRAELIRIIVGELGRITSHLIGNGALSLDIGAATPFTHNIRDREMVNDLFERICGARLTFSFVRPGGVAYDTPPGWIEDVEEFCDYFEPRIEQFDQLITFNKIFTQRLAGVAAIDTETAIDYGLVGPNLRGSGFRFDLRRDEPYGLYPEFDFEVPVGQGQIGKLGDCWDRFWVRQLEMRESLKIVRQACKKIRGETSSHTAKVKKILKPPKGEVYVRSENPRGEMGLYLVSDGTANSVRTRIRTGSFSAMGIFPKVAKGLMVADLIAVIASLDIVAPEIDR